jgi:hypothetical protein
MRLNHGILEVIHRGLNTGSYSNNNSNNNNGNNNYNNYNNNNFGYEIHDMRSMREGKGNFYLTIVTIPVSVLIRTRAMLVAPGLFLLNQDKSKSFEIYRYR